MRTRLSAILLHGMGQEVSWWAPFVPRLQELGLTVHVPTMPDLSVTGPEAWVEAAVAAIPNAPTLLIGHSLGAAVALQAAWRKPVEGVVLLAMPIAGARTAPKRPSRTDLSLAALSRVGRFLIKTAMNVSRTKVTALHLIGDKDQEVDIEQARQLPIPLLALPGADHDLNRLEADIVAVLAHIARTPAAQRWLDPAARRSLLLDTRHSFRITELTGDTIVPAPARLDIEVTTRCQLQCKHCARTLQHKTHPPIDMSPALFKRMMKEATYAEEIVFVGLGEPLLHPALEQLVGIAAAQGLRQKVVTNGLAATPERLARLRDAGLTEITFSIDSTDPQRFATLRGGAALEKVLDHFGRIPTGLQRSIFVTLSQINAGDLGGIAELARVHGLPAIAVSDLNFAENLTVTLHNGEVEEIIEAGLRTARAAGVLVLGPHLHEICDPTREYRHCLIRSASELSARAVKHTHCLAPWRIAVMGVSGEITPCNCAPNYPVGSLKHETLDQVWNGTPLAYWRKSVKHGTNAHCQSCPRY